MWGRGWRLAGVLSLRTWGLGGTQSVPCLREGGIAFEGEVDDEEGDHAGEGQTWTSPVSLPRPAMAQ